MHTDVLDLAVIGGGLLLLAGIALLIGRLEAAARDGAWRRIADARRMLHERERSLLDLLDNPQCRDCPSRRHLHDRHGP